MQEIFLLDFENLDEEVSEDIYHIVFPLNTKYKCNFKKTINVIKDEYLRIYKSSLNSKWKIKISLFLQRHDFVAMVHFYENQTLSKFSAQNILDKDIILEENKPISFFDNGKIITTLNSNFCLSKLSPRYYMRIFDKNIPSILSFDAIRNGIFKKLTIAENKYTPLKKALARNSYLAQIKINGQDVVLQIVTQLEYTKCFRRIKSKHLQKRLPIQENITKDGILLKCLKKLQYLCCYSIFVLN